MVDEYAILLAKIEDEQSALSQLSGGFEMRTRNAYLNARQDISDRINKIITDRGGLQGLSGRDRWRITRDTGLIEAIDGRLVQLGAEHTNLVSEAFQAGGVLARGHLTDEMTTLVRHINSASGVRTPLAAVVNFAQLDTVAIELGLGTALNDVTSLNQATRLTIQREVTRGVAGGEGIAKLSRRIELLDDLSRNRAEVITRWSTIKSYNLAHQATYEAAETQIPGLTKMWLAQTDERTCPHCLAQHGTVVQIADEFDPNLTFAGTAPEPHNGFLEVPPLHPRCRCTITSWHESWRAFTTQTPEELSSVGRDLSLQQGHPNASTAGITGVAPTVGIQDAASDALGDLMRGVYVFDDFSGTVRIVDGGDMNAARLALRDAGFRVIDVADDPRLLRIEWPQGLKLPRTIRSTRLKALGTGRWDEIKDGLLACGMRS